MKAREEFLLNTFFGKITDFENAPWKSAAHFLDRPSSFLQKLLLLKISPKSLLQKQKLGSAHA